MGGRGKWSYTASRMPNAKRAVIRRSKISNYLLNPTKSKDKYAFFSSLGYNMKNQARLQSDIRKGLKTSRVRVSEPNKYGTIHIQANMEIGINKRAKVVTGWVIKKGSKGPGLTTVRPYHGKRDDF